MKIRKMSARGNTMTIFTIGFIFIMIFTIAVGIAAMIFLSFDADSSENFTSKPVTQSLYDIVRRVNTETIETVDASGSVQQWTRSGQ